MPTIGTITVPDPSPSGTFPLTPDYGWQCELQPPVAVHQFMVPGSVNQKREQRFKLGDGQRRWTIQRDSLSVAERDALVAFWEARKASYQPFTFNAPSDDGTGTTAKTVRFDGPVLGITYLMEYLVTTGLTLVEVPTSTPSYAVTSTLERFPSSGLESALTGQAQELIPLVKIVCRDGAVPTIYLSDRRCTVGGTTYEPRLLKPATIAQTVGAANDEASFVFGNADRVMSDLAADTDLRRARMTYSLYHVGEETLVHVWAGELRSYAPQQDQTFRVSGSDPIFELTLPYPVGKLGRNCANRFDDGANCPYASVGSGGDPAFCDKTFAGTDGCVSHGMQSYFRGQFVEVQGATIKDNGTGMFGFGRTAFISTSITNQSNYGLPLPEIYTDTDMEVPAMILSGREESDFYTALGVVGQGPLGAYSRDSGDLAKHTLDGQWNHGREAYNQNASKYSQRFYGLRESLGPTPNTEPFGVANSSGPGPVERSAGTAFLEIRRTDPKGIQLTRPTEHEMKAWVSQGLSGWTWTNATTPVWAVLTNPIWVAVNAVLRSIGYRLSSGTSTATVQTIGAGIFDLQSAVDCAAGCNASVAALVGSGSETRWKFLGRLAEEKPLKDWLQEILNTCLGYYTFANGRMRFGLRSNSTAVNAFTAGNVVMGSLEVQSVEPSFNEVWIQFANRELLWQGDAAAVRDEGHAVDVGTEAAPRYLKSQMNLVGCATRSQAVRFGIIRLREELGGITAAEWKAAARVQFRSTVLALSTEPGQVVSLTDAELPAGAGEFRLEGWRLNEDYSIDFEARTTTDSMYDLASGEIGADVVPAEIPGPPVIELTPGNVIPISGDDFTVAAPVLVTDSQGVQRYQIDITYNPPTVIGTFDGVTVYQERDDEILPIGDYRYNGDGSDDEPERYGTARVLVEPPPGPGAETVYLYVLGKSATFRLPVIPRAEAEASPNMSISLDPADAIVGTPPGDVTINSVDYEYIDAYRLRVRIYWTAPDPLEEFAGVHCWEESPDVSTLGETTMDGTQAMDGTTDLGGEWAPIDRGRGVVSPFVIEMDAPAAAMTKRFYLVSFSTGAEAELVRATDASPTPSITLAITPAVYQSGVEYAQLVTGAVATIEYDDSQVASPKYRIRFQWTAPAIAAAAWQRGFGGTQIVYEYEDGSRANGPSLATNETDANSDWYDLYIGSSVVRCWFVSYDNSELPRLNTIVPGVTPFSDVTVVWPLESRPPEAPYADLVTNFTVSNARYATNGQGQKVLKIDWSWTLPVGAEALARWGGAVIYLFLPADTNPYQITGAESGNAGTMEFSQFPSLAETWTFYAISQDNNGNANTTAADPISGTPTDDIVVSPPEAGAAGTEWTANVTSPSFSVTSLSASDGTTPQRISATFTRPTDVTWGGVEIRVYDGATLVAKGAAAASPVAVTVPNPTSSVSYTVKLVSYDVNGQTNTETGSTPQGTVLVGSTAGTLDLRKFLPASTDNFTIVGSYLQVKTGVAITVDGSGNLRVATGGIVESLISSGAVTVGKIADGAVESAKLAAAAVTTAKLAVAAVTESIIAAGAITETKLGAAAVTNAKLAVDAVTASIIAAGAVTETKVATDAISTPKLQAGAITTAKIAAGAVTANEIAANTITAGKIAAGTITATELAADSISTPKLQAAAITTAKIAAGAVTANEIAANTITAAKIAAGTITAVEISSGAITTAKIAAGAVTASEIAALAVVAGKIAAGTVTATEIATDAITAGKILAGAVTTGKIAANAISSDKLDATVINVGGGGSKPGKFAVYNSGGSQIGFIGVNGSYNGAWFKECRVGGTSEANAGLVADSSGNLTISNATFTLNLNSAITDIGNLSVGGYTAGLRVKATSGSQAFHVAKDRIFSYDSSGNLLVDIISYLGSTAGLTLYESGSSRIEMFAGGAFSPSTVDLKSGGGGAEYRVAGTRVVSTRKTGWSLPTGTSDRTSFDTGTVALSDLAERVKALIEDLHSSAGHGLIGF